MSEDSFEKMDKDWMGRLARIRQKNIPEGIRRDFAKSVENRVMHLPAGGGFGWLAAVPALAVLIAVIWFGQNYFARQTHPLVVEARREDAAQLREADLEKEIETMKELGVWTEKDETAMGITNEQLFSELELDFDQPGGAIPVL